MNKKLFYLLILVFIISSLVVACQTFRDKNSNYPIQHTVENTLDVIESSLNPTTTQKIPTLSSAHGANFTELINLGRILLRSHFADEGSKIFEFVDNTLIELFSDPEPQQLKLDLSRKQAFFYQQDYDEEVRIYRVNLQTQETTLLIQNFLVYPCIKGFNGPNVIDFLPDENQLIYESCESGNYEIFSYDVSTGTRTNLTRSPGGDVSPSVSPVGNKIAFLSERTGRFQLFTMRENGEDLKQLTFLDNGNFDSVFWSPDGTRIAFQNTGESIFPELYLIDCDGGNLTQVTDRKDGYYVVGGRDAFMWSPDGTRILFSAFVEGTSQIFLLTATTLEVTQLTHGTMHSQIPRWSPDGKSILFIYGERYKGDLYIYDLLSSEQQLVLDLGLPNVTNLFWIP